MIELTHRKEVSRVEGRVKLIFEGKEYSALTGSTVKAALTDAGISFAAPCGGRRICGKCRVFAKGALSPLCEEEERYLSDRDIERGGRLACCAVIKGDVTVSRYSAEDGFAIETETPHLMSTDKDFGIGMALDIGTTTVVAAFYDRKRGERLNVFSALNPQRSCGADVVSRIECASSETGKLVLRNSILELVNGFIADFFDSISASSSEKIDSAVVSGNTAMELLFAGYGISSLGVSPFIPESLLGEWYDGKGLGLDRVKKIYMMPCCGPFFGGDAVASMLAAGFYGAEDPFFMADIGTNGEFAVTSDGKTFLATSAAAGPAFEGAEIRFGTGSIPGAICKVRSLDPISDIETIDKKAPVGICGSGITDVIAVGLEQGLISADGRITDTRALFEGQPALWLFGDIYLTQSDVRKVQLAKGAIFAAAEILLERMETLPNRSYLRGGFGTTIDVLSAERIGLLPSTLCRNAQSGGNGSLMGATKVLLSEESLRQAEYIVQNTQVISVAETEDFQRRFTEAMLFDEK